MGGHGGLNILPQKRWNVYGQRNRLKVHEDEAKYVKEQRLEEQRRDKAEREFKMERLRKKSSLDGHNSSNRHINLFEEEERLQEHAENKREREMEDRKRGRRSDRTSDARFDARFSFAHGLNDTKPWYALPSAKPTDNIRKDSDATGMMSTTDVEGPVKKLSKKKSKKKRANALLKELRRSNFKKKEIDKGLLRIERMRRERRERARAQALTGNGHQSR